MLLKFLNIWANYLVCIQILTSLSFEWHCKPILHDGLYFVPPLHLVKFSMFDCFLLWNEWSFLQKSRVRWELRRRRHGSEQLWLQWSNWRASTLTTWWWILECGSHAKSTKPTQFLKICQTKGESSLILCAQFYYTITQPNVHSIHKLKVFNN